MCRNGFEIPTRRGIHRCVRPGARCHAGDRANSAGPPSLYCQNSSLDTFATELVREAEIAGRIGPETDRWEQTPAGSNGLDPEIEWGAIPGRIQLNEEVTVKLTHEIDLGLFAGFGSFLSPCGQMTWKVGGVLEMNRLRQILKDRARRPFPLIIAIVLVLVMLMCRNQRSLLPAHRGPGVLDAVQEAVISTVNDNYDDVYHGVREGYFGAYQPLAGDFEE